MKDMEGEMKAAAKVATALKSDLASSRHKRDVLSEEVAALQKELVALREQMTISETVVAKISNDVEANTSKVSKFPLSLSLSLFLTRSCTPS